MPVKNPCSSVVLFSFVVFNYNVSAPHLKEGLTILEPGNTIAGGGGEEGTEVVAEARGDVQGFIDGIIVQTSVLAIQKPSTPSERQPVPY